MGRPALLEALRAKADEDAQAAWAVARREAGKYREELAATLEARREELAQAREAEARARTGERLAEARHQARELRMSATVELAARLREMAAAGLAQLGREGAQALFEALAEELPERDWQAIRVSPAAAEAAGSRFPNARLETDASISGGLEVMAEDGRLRVDNTLEARLETAWPDLLPGLVAEAMALRDSHGPAA